MGLLPSSRATSTTPPLPPVPSTTTAMVLKGKGKLVASDPTSGVTTKASASRRGEKRRRGLGDEAEPPPSLPDAKRPGGRCGCVPKTVDDYDLDNGTWPFDS